MAAPRYLCSHLVRLSAGGRTRWANLEEIWNAGAILDCEEEVMRGDSVTMSSEEVFFDGRVTAVEREESGWRVEVLFSEYTPWTIERWMPEHALNPETLLDGK
jgi:hypothetical protein